VFRWIGDKTSRRPRRRSAMRLRSVVYSLMTSCNSINVIAYIRGSSSCCNRARPQLSPVPVCRRRPGMPRR